MWTQTIEFDSRIRNCRRCGKEVTEDVIYVRHLIAPPDGRKHYFSGETMMRDSVYHRRCLPSNLFHRLAGSLPVGQSPAGASLRKEHAVGGGLSFKKRKRPSRRTRYKRTAVRRKLEADARDERRDEAITSRTIQDLLKSGGKPRLCHCRTFSDSTSLLTTHGYCRYCGGWTPEIFRAACGEESLQQAISELDIHRRTKMTLMTKTDNDL